MTAVYAVFLPNIHGASRNQEPDIGIAKNRAMDFMIWFGEKITIHPSWKPNQGLDLHSGACLGLPGLQCLHSEAVVLLWTPFPNSAFSDLTLSTLKSATVGVYTTEIGKCYKSGVFVLEN